MGGRCLIVEDERIVAMALQDQLADAGFEVIGNVWRGQDAIDAALEQSPDVVLIDIHLGGEMDGIAASHAIRAGSGAAVVFLTAYSDEATLRRAGATVPSGYLLKPVQQPQLRAVVEMAVYQARAERERAKLVAKLQEAADEIGRLRSLLPMCAWCRKVSTSDGYWQDLALYLKERFGAVVSHGICETCSAQMIGQQDDPQG